MSTFTTRQLAIADEHVGEFMKDEDRAPDARELVELFTARLADEADDSPLFAEILGVLEVLNHPPAPGYVADVIRDLVAERRPVLGEELLGLAEDGEALIEALELFARRIREAGGRDSHDLAVRRFAAYHLADLEGQDAGGWLGGPFLRDAVVELIRGGGAER